MPAPKGNKFSTGRPVGAKSRKTKEWEALGDAIMSKHSERFNQILENCKDDQFIDKFLQVLEYFQPKLARTESHQEVNQETTIRFEFNNSFTPPSASQTSGVPDAPEEV